MITQNQYEYKDIMATFILGTKYQHITNNIVDVRKINECDGLAIFSIK